MKTNDRWTTDSSLHSQHESVDLLRHDLVNCCRRMKRVPVKEVIRV